MAAVLLSQLDQTCAEVTGESRGARQEITCGLREMRVGNVVIEF